MLSVERYTEFCIIAYAQGCSKVVSKNLRFTPNRTTLLADLCCKILATTPPSMGKGWGPSRLENVQHSSHARLGRIVHPSSPALFSFLFNLIYQYQPYTFPMFWYMLGVHLIHPQGISRTGRQPSHRNFFGTLRTMHMFSSSRTRR